MKLLAVLRPREGVDVRAEVSRHADAELRALWELYRDGVVREMYSPGSAGAILVLEAESVKEADRQVARFPLVASGTMVPEIIELHPFAAIEMLFATPTASRHE
jgi:hypothetical protein